jgi:hypothetical protein
MNPWLETIAVVLVALSGVLIGLRFSRFRSSYWTLAYFLPMLLIAMLVIGRCGCVSGHLPALLWITAGRLKFVVLSFAIPMGLTTTLSRLPHKSEKLITCILMAVVVVWTSVLPFLVPALLKDFLLSRATLVDSNGICFQTTDYTCGPAAAVTALRKLGFPAEEGEIAVLSHSNPVCGTLSYCLYAALCDRYGAHGLKCQYRRFDHLGQLRDAGITLATVKSAFLSDHCVVVLAVSNRLVTVADPVLGRRLLSHEQFEKIWRFSGIVLARDPANSI